MQLLKNREILYPDYKSHAGRDKWIQLITDEFNVAKNVASIWLEHPQIPVEKIYNTFTNEEIEYLGSLNPFSSRGSHTLPNCFFLKDNYPEISLKKSYYLNLGLPSINKIAKDSHDAYKLNKLIEDYGFNYSQISKIPNAITLPIKTLMSKIYNIKEDVFKYMSNAQIQYMSKDRYRLENPVINTFLNLMNPTYVPRIFPPKTLIDLTDLTLNDLVKTGITHKKIIEVLTQNNTKFQNIDPQLIKIHANKLFSDKLHNILYYNYNTKKDVWKQLFPSPFNDNNTSVYITHAQSIEVWEWMTKHPKWVTFQRNIQAPSGGNVTIYNHQLCDHITNDMLSSGSKTSPSVIEEKLNNHVKQQIKKMLDQNIQFPKYPKPIKNPKIKQILNSITLKNEGEIMQHCVGSYVTAAKSGHTFIFHVDDDTPHGATIEVSPTGKILQCRGVSNAPASKAQQIAEEEFNPKPNT